MTPLARVATLAIVIGLGLGFVVAADGSHASQDHQTARAVFAGGCFWCMEPPFDGVAGVTATTSGYSGGATKHPTYEQVSEGRSGHLEVLEITYDASRVSYEALLDVFWRNVDPLDGGGQFCDRGPQYRPAIFYQSEEEKRLADASKQQIATRLGKPVHVQILPAAPFYAAEGYHQDYYKKNPVRYKFYSWNCGRAQRLQEIWGPQA